jgi:hypothetical protein
MCVLTTPKSGFLSVLLICFRMCMVLFAVVSPADNEGIMHCQTQLVHITCFITATCFDLIWSASGH